MDADITTTTTADTSVADTTTNTTNRINTLFSSIANAFQTSKSEPDLSSTEENAAVAVTATTNTITRKHKLFTTILKAFQSLSESSGWMMTNFIFFMFMLVGLAAAGASTAVWFQAIFYFFIGSVLMCSVFYPIETKIDESQNDEFWKCVQFILLITSLVLIIIIFPLYGAGVSSVFLILAFSHGLMLLLFDMLLSAPFPIVTTTTVQKNLKIFAFSDTPVAEFSSLSVEKYNDRLFKGIYGLAVILNATAFLLSTYAQTSPFFGAGTGTATVVNSLDVNASSIPRYGLCSEDVYSLNPVDMSYLVALTYFKDPTNSSYDCGFFESTNLVKCLNNYFIPTYTIPNTNKSYSWQLLNISIPKDNRANTKTAYYGIISTNANLIIVGVRGSTTGRDWLEDFNLYVEVTMLQAFSLLVPYIYVWPVAATGQFVKALSFIDVLTFLNGNRTYYEPVIEYISELQKQYPKYDYAVIGHSLGGATSGIVGAKMNIR
jgi:hypothetical protein